MSVSDYSFSRSCDNRNISCASPAASALAPRVQQIYTLRWDPAPETPMERLVGVKEDHGVFSICILSLQVGLQMILYLTLLSAVH